MIFTGVEMEDLELDKCFQISVALVKGARELILERFSKETADKLEITLPKFQIITERIYGVRGRVSPKQNVQWSHWEQVRSYIS